MMYNLVTTLFHYHRIPGRYPDKMIDLVTPQLEKTGSENNNIPRWEENAVKISGINHSVLESEYELPNE